MQIKLAVVVPLLPFFVQAIPLRPLSGTKITLSRRSTFSKHGVVDLTSLQSHIGRVQAKIARGFANYEKNTGRVHPNWRNTTAGNKRNTGTVPLTNDDNLLWQGTISVGTPAVDFAVDFDTGSSDTFFPGPGCGSTRTGHTQYDPSKSSTSQDAGQPFELEYANGAAVYGEQFTDTVSLGNLTATDQYIGAASQFSSQLESDTFPPDGLFGLAFEEISNFAGTPVFQTLLTQGQLDSGEFGFTLLQNGSELFLGGVDSSKFSGSLAYTDVTQKGFWQVVLEGASVGSQQVFSNVDAIVDTGTSLIIGDSESVQSLYAAIPGAEDGSSSIGQGLFTFPCDSAPDNISFTLGEKQFTISADTFNLGAVDDGSNDCVGGIIADDSQGAWILGDVFLSNVYTSFDVDNLRVGFAPIN